MMSCRRSSYLREEKDGRQRDRAGKDAQQFQLINYRAANVLTSEESVLRGSTLKRLLNEKMRETRVEDL